MPRFLKVPAPRSAGADGTKNRRPEVGVSSPTLDADGWRDAQYLRNVRSNHMQAHFCAVATTIAVIVALYAATKGAWPVVALMGLSAIPGIMFAFGLIRRSYFWQKHDRVMFRCMEKTEQAACKENVRLRHENNELLIAGAKALGYLTDDMEKTAKFDTAIHYLDGRRVK